ncbi:MAG TPA: hypothetical protein PLF59_08195 [Cyclobacteriaceae bacterium]|nr:hypothetical protein [Cyclobacteriaceae bacterium]HNC31468.1 hypothetical protein [Cyclobacteriaceae bacterium]
MAVFLTLGSITFANFEIPDALPFGLDQALSIKKMVGGARQIDAMGRDYHPISWEGRFRGSTALFRARYLESLVNGQPLPLFWSQFNYLVIIRSFKPIFEKTYEIPYTITVEVVQDQTNPFTTLVPVAYNDAVDAMMLEAEDLAAAISDPDVSSAIAILAEALNAIPSLSNASDNTIASLTPLINNCSLAVSAAIASIGAGL